MKRDEIDRLVRMVAAATPGPWHTDQESRFAGAVSDPRGYQRWDRFGGRWKRTDYHRKGR